MSKYGPTRQKLRRVQLGDMRHLIEIQVRDIGALTNALNVDFTENFTTTNTVYAAYTTKKGDSMFDGTNLIYAPTGHYFTIRYITDLTEEKFIKFDGNLYDIEDIEDFDGRKMFMVLNCRLRGEDNLPVNRA